MIGTDEPMALVVTSGGAVRGVISLGYSTFESVEFDKLYDMANFRGYSVYLTTITEPNRFESVVSDLIAIMG
jgi:hypothetical protein